MDIAETRYAKTADGVHIAYQAVGTGPVDIVFVMGWTTHIELMWKEPTLARFLSRLLGFGFRISGIGSRVSCLGFRVSDIGPRLGAGRKEGFLHGFGDVERRDDGPWLWNARLPPVLRHPRIGDIRHADATTGEGGGTVDVREIKP